MSAHFYMEDENALSPEAVSVFVFMRLSKVAMVFVLPCL